MDIYLLSIYINNTYEDFYSQFLAWHHGFPTSAADLAGNQLHMHDPIFFEYSTHQVGLSTSLNYNYSHCFERWVGPNYLLLFQVSGHVCIGLQGWTTKIHPPFWVRPNPDSNFPDYTWAYLGTYLFYPSFLLNEHIHRSFEQFRIHLSCSLPFNRLK